MQEVIMYIDDTADLATHLSREVFQRTGLLHDEAELLLRQSITAPANDSAVLRAIAHGHNRANTISQRTQLEPNQVHKILTTLERIGLIAKLRPVTTSERAKKTAYAVTDQFLRFHYRFVEPAKSRLRTTDLAERHLTEVVLPRIDHHASIAWEDICREYVRDTVPSVGAVGRWWGQVPTGEGRRTEERELDVVGLDTSGRPAVFGMCKWTTDEVDFGELNLLDQLAAHVPGGADAASSASRMLFSRSGFTPRLRAAAEYDDRLLLVEPEHVYS